MRKAKKLAMVLILATLLPASASVLAKDEKSSKSGAALGSKELLARIEQLELALSELQSTTADVAGSVYTTFLIGNGFGVLNAPNVGHFQTIASRVRTLIFNTDNTGSWSIDECLSQQLSEFGTSPAQIDSSPGCSGPSLINFTYVQNGSAVEITPNGAPASVLLTVSSDGGVLGSAQGGSFGNPAAPGGVNGVGSNLILGLRIGQ
ncbi:MAG: hypothetical protein H7A05_06670 [Pseudomonadales bacterium]|nr:hypothetical protein [Pseudomonadales bacterium]MCP5330659.1 hypothetical protein [Pseudomonadales bacterium]MCP5344285.1 hypothetical protein [Pseudomonadales bacterium]